MRHALRQRALEAENRDLRAQVDRRHTLIGESPAMRHLREQVLLAAPTNGRVLILGENGTGKEVVARTLHAHSRRRSGPFVEVNCAAIPEELIESELFGHARGAFTGAVADRRGRFEHAHGGTIFLDEIGDMSLKTQAKVLRALQEQVVQPVGGTATVRVDVRVVAATNKDLQDEIRGRPLPRGPVLPAQRRPDLRAAAARPRRRRAAAGRALHGDAGRRVRPAAQAVRSRGDGPAAAAQLAGQRSRAAQRRRAAADHGGRRRDHPERRRLRRRLAAGAAGAGQRRRRPCRWPRPAISSSATTSSRCWRPTRATSRAPPTPSASSAATSTRRCAASGSRRRGATPD